MSARPRVAVVYNPRAAHGRTGRQWPALEAALRKALGDLTALPTERPNHATELVRRALREGADRIISVGGDGTHWEVVNGFFDADGPVNPEAVMGIVPCGTGSDLARTLAMPSGAEAVRCLAGWRTIAADVGRVTYARPDGGEGCSYFLNSAHLGMGGEVVARVNRTTKRFGGFLSFLWGTVATLLRYENVPLELEIDGAPLACVCRDVILANGQYDGGGMHVAPRARLDSGRLEVYVIGDVGPLEGLRCLPLLYRGRLDQRPDLVQHFQAVSVTARSDGSVPIALDGEQPGGLPATLEVVPRALRLAVGPDCDAVTPDVS